ncbi:MAG: hypothetical protein HYW70_00830 [Candidatus Nealsonbacteria bacterium]|nr:hypothetical protein [Candidatus Nealsonbacteria bacterium]
MKEIIDILWFTDPAAIVWNVFAYLGMVLIITGIVSSRFRNRFFFLGPFILFLYALLYLKDPILTGLQLLISLSGGLNLFNVRKKLFLPVLHVSTVAVYGILLFAGQISGAWQLIGSLGLLGIAFSYTQLPNKRGFLFMGFSGLLIVAYSFVSQVWIWFVLNIVFFFTSIIEFKRKDAKNEGQK